MRFISYRRDGISSFGLLNACGVVDLRQRTGAPSLKTLIAQDRLDQAGAFAAADADFAIADLELAPVIPDPDAILCVGLNYEDHRAETKRPVVAHPTIFLRVASSLQAHGRDLLIPENSDQFDYEGEMALIIGKGGRRISEQDAWSHIAGVACFNDASVRDWQYHTQQFGPGKNFPGTGAFGPALVTPDELPADKALAIETRVNGQVMQRANTRDMIFPVPRLVAYCSTFMALSPGDVIVTGTPGGVGAKRQPPFWMKHGDTVEVELEGVGLLSNVCAKER